MQLVNAVSEPISGRLWSRGAACLCGVGTYLPETVRQECSLVMHCQILLPADLSAGVQPVYAVSKPTSLGQWCRGAACLCSVGTYLGGTVGQVCSLVKRCQNLSLWDCGQG